MTPDHSAGGAAGPRSPEPPESRLQPGAERRTARLKSGLRSRLGRGWRLGPCGALFTCLALSVFVAFAGSGCSQNEAPPAGDGTPNDTEAPALPWTGPTGSVRVRVVWPEPRTPAARAIPDAAASIGLRLFVESTGQELTGLPGMENLPLNKPGGAPPWPEQTIALTQVPTLDIRFDARAYSGADAAGDELAVCVRIVTMLPEDTPGSNPTPVDLALGVPTPSVTPTSLDFGLTETELAFDIANATDTGPGTLSWTVSADQPWITLAPLSGTDADTVTVTVSRNGLTTETYTGTVTVSSGFGAAEIGVSMDVLHGPADSPWPMCGRDPQHTHRSPHVGPETATEKWRISVGWLTQTGLAIGTDGTLYIVEDVGTCHAVSPDGSSESGFGPRVWGTPAVGADGMVFMGSYGGSLYAVNPDGTQRWAFDTSGEVGSPTIGTDGTVYVGSTDSNLYAVNPDGTQRWAFGTGGYVGSPTIGTDGTVYVGSTDNKLHAVTPDGTQKWAFPTGGGVGSPAIGADGTVYVGSADDNLYAVDPDGAQKWAFPTGGDVGSPAIGGGGTVYVGSGDKSLYAVDPGGTQEWEFPTQGDMRGAPVVDAGGTIYIGSQAGYQDGNLYAVNQDGTQKWVFPAVEIWGTVAIGADGTVYVPGDYLYAIGP